MGLVEKKIHFIAGLPRTGSTLLSAILSQNPLIHAEGNSALCQLMWDMEVSCKTSAAQQLQANNRFETQYDLISELPKLYYRKINRPIVFDKCRSWTLESNFNMIKKYVNEDARIVVLTRPIDEIVQSFVRLAKNNNSSFNAKDLLTPHSEPIMRSLDGVDWAKKQGNKNFLFIEYRDLCDYPKEVVDSIYSFCGLDNFEHDFNNVEEYFPENDAIYGLSGMHSVRQKVGAE
jgi:sulfotransferase